MKFHPISRIFPLMEGKAFTALVADIRKHGVREAIWLFEGEIIDGRNRYRACEELKIECPTRVWKGDSPVAFVVSENLHRRHLDAGQRAMLAERILPKLEAEAKQRQATSTGGKKPQLMAKMPQAVGTSRDQAGELAQVSPRYVQQAKAVRKDNPGLAAKVESGEVKLADAVRQVKRQAIREKLEDIETREAKALEGTFDVVVIDPPWPIEKIERDERPNQSETDYPTMALADIEVVLAEKVKRHTAADCHVWLWTTQKFLPAALPMLPRLGLRYVCTFVWKKPGGFQPMNLPQYNCEFILYARKGSPQFLDTKNFFTCFEGARGKHSEKPEEFYAFVRRVTAGRRLDMFSRRKIDGFEGWGQEADGGELAGRQKVDR